MGGKAYARGRRSSDSNSSRDTILDRLLLWWHALLSTHRLPQRSDPERRSPSWTLSTPRRRQCRFLPFVGCGALLSQCAGSAYTLPPRHFRRVGQSLCHERPQIAWATQRARMGGRIPIGAPFSEAPSLVRFSGGLLTDAGYQGAHRDNTWDGTCGTFGCLKGQMSLPRASLAARKGASFYSSVAPPSIAGRA